VYNKKTLGCISSLLNLDTFSAKRKKPLHQRLQSANCIRISEFKNKSPPPLMNKMADEPQEKPPPLLPFSNASEVVQ
jgi:hypothetical protein